MMEKLLKKLNNAFRLALFQSSIRMQSWTDLHKFSIIFVSFGIAFVLFHVRRANLGLIRKSCSMFEYIKIRFKMFLNRCRLMRLICSRKNLFLACSASFCLLLSSQTRNPPIKHIKAIDTTSSLCAKTGTRETLF